MKTPGRREGGRGEAMLNLKMPPSFLITFIFALLLLSCVEQPRIPEGALVRLDRGKELIAAGKYDAAIAEFDRALAIHRDWAEAYSLRGFVYLRKGGYDRAIADFEALLRLEPNHASARRWLEDARQARGR